MGSAIWPLWSAPSPGRATLVSSRRYGTVPTHAVGAFCGVTAVLAWLCHFAVEATVLPTGWQWLVVAFMGLGPMGLAFFAWDHGVKHGSIKSLAVFSYFAPLISTLLLIAAGQAEASWSLALSCVLIIGGAALASGWARRSSAASTFGSPPRS